MPDVVTSHQTKESIMSQQNVQILNLFLFLPQHLTDVVSSQVVYDVPDACRGLHMLAIVLQVLHLDLMHFSMAFYTEESFELSFCV